MKDYNRLLDTAILRITAAASYALDSPNVEKAVEEAGFSPAILLNELNIVASRLEVVNLVGQLSEERETHKR